MTLGLPTWHLKSSYLVIRILISQMRHRALEGYQGERLKADMGPETQDQKHPPTSTTSFSDSVLVATTKTFCSVRPPT